MFKFKIIPFLFLAFYFIFQASLVSKKKNIIYIDNFTNASQWNFIKVKFILSNNSLIQSDINEWNTHCYRKIQQSGVIFYEYNVIMNNGILDAGLHIYASKGSLSQRGTSYLIWQYKLGFVIYKTISNRLIEKNRFDSPNFRDKQYKCKIKYDPDKGIINIWKDGVLIGQWIDKNPIQSGDYISFRTNKTVAEFSDLKIYR